MFENWTPKAKDLKKQIDDLMVDPFGNDYLIKPLQEELGKELKSADNIRENVGPKQKSLALKSTEDIVKETMETEAPKNSHGWFAVTEDQIDLENGENWLSADSLENYDNQIKEWENFSDPRAKEIAQKLHEERSNYALKVASQNRKQVQQIMGKTYLSAEQMKTELDRLRAKGDMNDMEEIAALSSAYSSRANHEYQKDHAYRESVFYDPNQKYEIGDNVKAKKRIDDFKADYQSLYDQYAPQLKRYGDGPIVNKTLQKMKDYVDWYEKELAILEKDYYSDGEWITARGGQGLTDALANTAEAVETAANSITGKSYDLMQESYYSSGDNLRNRGAEYGKLTNTLGAGAEVVGNIAPSIVMGSTFSPVVGQIFNGIQAAGRTSRHARSLGVSDEDVLNSAIVSGVSSVSVERLFGGIAGLGKGSTAAAGIVKPTLGQRMFGYGVDAVGEGMEGVTDYVLNNAVQQTYDPSAPQITIRDMVQVLGKDATLSLILGAMPREAGYGVGKFKGSNSSTLNSNFPINTKQGDEASKLQNEKRSYKSNDGQLNWEKVISKKGETRIQHINKHAVPNPERITHGVFFGEPKKIIEDAWKNKGSVVAIEDGMGGIIYNIPYYNAGYESGSKNDGAIMHYVTIVVKKDTAEIITAFPSFGDYTK